MSYKLPRHADHVPPDEPNTFRDLEGDLWTLKINYGNAEDVLASCGVDLVNAHNGKAYGKIVEDDRTLVALLHCLLEKQIEQRNLDPHGFAERLDGAVLAAALDAMRVAIENFTRPDVRPALNQLNSQIDKTRQKAIKIALRKLSSPMAEAAIDRALDKEETAIDQKLAAIADGDTPPNSPALSD